MRAQRDVVDGWARGISGSDVRDDRVVHVEHIWGTVITIHLAGTRGCEQAALAAIEQCCELFTLVDLTFSTYKPHSEVTLYRNGIDHPGGQSPEFEEVLAACRDLRRATHGAFDPWSVPGGYDPSGYVKGWAAARASARLVDAGFNNHFVNAGGDICASGDEYPGSARGWPVGIRNPHEATEVIGVVELRNQSMATSGRYERGNHVVEPATGAAVARVDSATVVGGDLGVADAVASAVLVDGPASMQWFRALGPDWSLCIVIGTTVHTDGPAFEERPTQL